MSQRSQLDGSQTGLLAGRGLLAAAETLNFSMNDHQGAIMTSRLGMGGSMVGQGGTLASQRGPGSQLGSTVKLVASLGLSPSDLDALAQIPEENISMETLPQILMKIKSQKADAGEWQGPGSISSGGARLSASSLGQASASSDFGRSSLQESSSRSLNFSRGRDRGYSDLPRHEAYSSLDVTPPDTGFLQRRMGSPSYTKAQDFLGALPNMFPHVCSLCDFDVFSMMEWNQHTQGQRHAENRRLLLNLYPDWDPFLSSNRRRVESSNMSPGLLGPPPLSSGTTSAGMLSSWGPSGNSRPGQNLRSRVVVVKYDRKPQNSQMLLSLAKRFGRLREHLILKNKAFLEMDSHEGAMDMVNYYQQNQPSLFGKPLNIYLSQRLMVIEKDGRSSDRTMDREALGQGSQVVFFSKLPREEAKKKELLTIAERFGTVEKHLFLTDQAFIQLGSPEDAEMLVKYYTVNPLTLRGQLVHLNICTKYKTLTVNRRQTSSSDDSRGQRSDGTSTASRATSKTTKGELRPAVQEKEPLKEKDRQTRMESSGGVADLQDQVRLTETAVSLEQGPDHSPEQEVAVETPADLGGVMVQAEEPAEQTEEGKVQPRADPENTETTDGDLFGPEDLDIPENIEDFVTLDEVAVEEDDGQEAELNDVDNSRRGGMRVVSIVGFRRGHNFLNEILALAKPFGEVKRHLVLDLKPQAYVQFETEQEAQAMAKFYGTNVTASVCGRTVRISHSLAYPTIRCGSSKVVYVGQIPISKYSDSSLLKLAEPYGKIRKYFLNRNKRECFIEMETSEEAEKMAEACKADPPRFNSKRLTVYVSRKYRQLKYGHLWQSSEKKEQRNPTTPDDLQEPPAKRLRTQEEDKTETPEGEARGETPEGEARGETPEGGNNTTPEEEEGTDKTKELYHGEVKTEARLTEESQGVFTQDLSSAPGAGAPGMPLGKQEVKTAGVLPPFDPNTPVGVEQVQSGFYCHVCFLFFADEETAKKLHCSSRAHYDYLQKYLEKEARDDETLA
ncbi:matrin 3-like 1.2 [Neosynchiropus ocellatus]